MNQELAEDLRKKIGHFTWDFGHEWWIETDIGNFIWSDPDYGGDNTMREATCSYSKWIGDGWGRSKGMRLVERYCGDFKIA